MSGSQADVIDTLVGVAPGSPLDGLRARRPEARTQAQASYMALFKPDVAGEVTAQERHAVASFVAGLHGVPETAAFYASGLAEYGASAELRGAVNAEIAAATAHGPYGSYPHGPLSAENQAGPTYKVAEASYEILGSRLSAAFEHAQMLVLHPRDSASGRLGALLKAGWSTTDVVTLSQLVAFMSFQIRVVTGLKTLATTF